MRQARADGREIYALGLNGEKAAAESGGGCAAGAPRLPGTFQPPARSRA